MGKPRILILGGTTEARRLAEALALRDDIEAMVSLAGRTADPQPLPLPVRIGGFGGVDGLGAFLRDQKIDLLVDATHPFAAQISAHAAAAAASTGVAAFAVERPGWSEREGDRWVAVGSVAEAVTALEHDRRNVFLAIGRQEAGAFSAAPQHTYLVRSVDPVDPPLAVPDCRYILASGPFDEESERHLLESNGIDVVVTKNSGGSATYGKIAAARALGIEVIMIERPAASGLEKVHDVASALARVDQLLFPLMKRGV